MKQPPAAAPAGLQVMIGEEAVLWLLLLSAPLSPLGRLASRLSSSPGCPPAKGTSTFPRASNATPSMCVTQNARPPSPFTP
jgi:hypothetical protein